MYDGTWIRLDAGDGTTTNIDDSNGIAAISFYSSFKFDATA